VLQLVQALTREQALGDQSTALEPGRGRTGVLGCALPVRRGILRFRADRPRDLPAVGAGAVGLPADRPRLPAVRRDLGAGILLVVVIGVPGLGLYAAGRSLGITVQVDAAPLDASWWTVPLLLIAALRAGLTEEVIFIGYLFDRLRRLGWGTWTIILSTAALRGAYHAYQGFGSIVGNMAMGIVFGWVYRWGRVMPLVIAHTVIDVIAFVGYPLAAAWWPGLF
jgi:membrane protease YdiL (CAAX protease family)